VELAAFFIIALVLCVIDIRAMLQDKLKKEIVPYGFLMLLAGLVGALFFTEPFRKSIVYLMMKTLGIGE